MNIKLRPLRTTDFDAYYQLVSNSIIAKGARFTPARNKRTAKKLFSDDMNHADSYAVVLNARMIGMVSLYATIGKHGAPNKTNLELAYMMRPSWQGHGYMTRAVYQMIQLLKHHRLSVKRLVALVNERNVASRAILIHNHFSNYQSIMNMNSDDEDLVYQRDLKK